MAGTGAGLVSSDTDLPSELIKSTTGILPWIAWALVSSWVIFLRVMLGSHYKRAETTEKRLDRMDRRLARIEGALGIPDYRREDIE